MTLEDKILITILQWRARHFPGLTAKQAVEYVLDELEKTIKEHKNGNAKG
jgi:hypothetical protein